jgi:hypothetical protein
MTRTSDRLPLLLHRRAHDEDAYGGQYLVKESDFAGGELATVWPGGAIAPQRSLSARVFARNRRYDAFHSLLSKTQSSTAFHSICLQLLK